MTTCPAGHASATDDYCDVCGTPLAEADAPVAAPQATSAPAPAPDSAAESEQTCASCGSARAGRFCEECGHDSLAPVPARQAPSVLPGVTPTGAAAPGTAPPEAPGPAVPASASAAGGASAGASRWYATVEADREYHLRVLAIGGPDAATVPFPDFCPPRRFELLDEQVTIGRRSRSRGVFPTVDLTGPPEDPGISHSHALLVRSGAEWALVDLGSTNGTTVNGEPDPVRPNEPRPLADGDRVHVGAWTTITLRRAV